MPGKKKSVVSESRQLQLAIELIDLGARLQVLEAETDLSHERLIKLYKELKGMSPPKGMLPFSTDWFITWMPNIQSSLFINVYRFMTKHAGLGGIEAQIKAYRLFLEHIRAQNLECELSFTRAWSLVRFFAADMLRTAPCTRCGGDFVVHTHELYKHYVCGLCNPPSRAGKSRKAKQAQRTPVTA